MVSHNKDHEITDFKLGDWGTAGANDKFFGGTPGYASKHMYYDGEKDPFSIGRLAMCLFVEKTGIVNNLKIKTKYTKKNQYFSKISLT